MASVSPNGVHALLNPRNVVIVGASDKPGNWAQRVWRNLHRYKCPVPIYPLNPGRDSVWDTRCYKSFAELPEAPDHLVLLIPAPFVPDALRDAAKAGARSATVMSSGFDEATDEKSKSLGAKLKAVIEDTGIAVSGPNCLGNFNAHASFVTLPDDRPQRITPGPVAVFGQSGGIVMAMKRTMEERGIDSGYLITSGNETGLTTADYIRYFAEDSATKVIVSYLESVHDPESFLAACRKARDAGKPVVVAKLGASDEGRAAAMAHTGALAGSMQAFDAIAGEAGVIRVGNLDDVVETVEYLLHAPLPKGTGLGGITFSGGFRGLMLDKGAKHGLRFAELAPQTRAKLEKILTVGTIIGNPLDSGFAALSSQDAYIKCVEALLEDPSIDVLLLQEEIPRAPGTERKENNLRAVNDIVARVKKPVAYVTMISHSVTDYSRELRAQIPHLAIMQEIDKSIGAVRSVMDYAARISTPAPKAGAASPAKSKLDKVLSKITSAEPLALSEVNSKAILKAYGLKGPKELVARSAAEAARHARAIGFPGVLKAIHPKLTHKSDAGGVLIGLDSPAAVTKGFAQIAKSVKAKAKLAIEGVIVAEMVTGGLELVLGATRDPEMGPVVMFGSGGVALELYRDVAFAAPPLDAHRAEDLIARTRAAKLIAGYRGSKALDRKALVEALVAFSRLVSDLGDRLHSIDVNPFVLRPKGGVALDALVVVAPGKR
ncbi:MAG TPA: acetate--CoA ligase family protein [Alphaproteobacteria bacterium]|nr:acetate--CoA ligase family protein [Alphaproteobacteria bacterium]